jgi:hypothetical protein
MASVRVVVIAVDRNAVARAEGVTAFLCGESRNGSCPRFYLIEYVDKITNALEFRCLRHHRGEIAADKAVWWTRQGGGVALES